MIWFYTALVKSIPATIQKTRLISLREAQYSILGKKKKCYLFSNILWRGKNSQNEKGYSHVSKYNPVKHTEANKAKAKVWQIQPRKSNKALFWSRQFITHCQRSQRKQLTSLFIQGSEEGDAKTKGLYGNAMQALEGPVPQKPVAQDNWAYL